MSQNDAKTIKVLKLFVHLSFAILNFCDIFFSWRSIGRIRLRTIAHFRFSFICIFRTSMTNDRANKGKIFLAERNVSILHGMMRSWESQRKIGFIKSLATRLQNFSSPLVRGSGKKTKKKKQKNKNLELDSFRQMISGKVYDSFRIFIINIIIFILVFKFGVKYFPRGVEVDRFLRNRLIRFSRLFINIRLCGSRIYLRALIGSRWTFFFL